MNNYQYHYDKLVETRRGRVPEKGNDYEKHRVVMKSMGGSDEPDNIVVLTAREHFLAHWLLWRIHRNRETAAAFAFMKRHCKSARLHAELREASFLANKEFWTKLSAEERFTIVSERMKKWSPESRKAKAADASKKFWSSLSPEEIHEKQSRASHRRWDKMTSTDRAESQSLRSKKTWNVSKEERSERAKLIWAKRRENGTNHRLKKPLTNGITTS